MNQQKVIRAVETICSTGCASVNAIIQILELNNTLEGFEDFTDAEINALKNELKSIMAVYEDKK